MDGTIADFGTTALKNADDMMQEIVRMVDVNRDGKIQYEGMIDHAEVVCYKPDSLKLDIR